MEIGDFSKSIDALSTDTVVLALFEDEKPPRDISGLIDWRLHGILSKTLKKHWFTGEKHELCLIPVRTRFNARRILLVGAGRRSEWSMSDVLSAGTKVAAALKDMDVHEVALWCPKAVDESSDRKTKQEFLRGVEMYNRVPDLHVLWLEQRVLQLS